MRHESSAIGLSSTLLAVTIPEAWLSYGGRLIFTLVTAALASAVSAIISNWLRKGSK